MITNLQIYPINTRENLDKVMQAGRDDMRQLLYPTHAVVKNEEIVGAFCTSSPTVFWWMNPNKVTNRDSVIVFQSLVTLLNNNKTESYIIPCHPKSSYYPTLSKRVGDGLDIYKGDGNDDWTIFLRK